MFRICIHNFILMVSFFCLPLYAQDTGLPVPSKNMIGFRVSPEYCYRKLTADATTNWLAEQRDTMEVPKPGITASFFFQHSLKNKFALETGIAFSDKGYRTKPYYTLWISSGNAPDPNIPETVRFSYHYFYLEIPVKLRYNLLTGQKSELSFSAGFSPSVFLWVRSLTNYTYGNGSTSSSSSSSQDVLRRIHLSANLSVEYRYLFSAKWGMSIAPNISSSVISIINAPVRGYFYSAGLALGAFLKL